MNRNRQCPFALFLGVRPSSRRRLLLGLVWRHLAFHAMHYYPGQRLAGMEEEGDVIQQGKLTAGALTPHVVQGQRYLGTEGLSQ